MIDQNLDYPNETASDQHKAKREVRKRKRQMLINNAFELKPRLPDNLKHAMVLAQEKGASNWLTVLPMKKFGYSLHKGAFRDAITLCYGELETTSRLCMQQNILSGPSLVSCPKGVFPIIRHNEIHYLTGNLLKVCHNVSIEPHLHVQLVTTESFTHATANSQDGARLDAGFREANSRGHFLM